MQDHRNAYRPNLNGANQETKKKPNDASHPYVPLQGVWLSGNGLRWGRCCNLLHFVLKLLHSHAGSQKDCRLFTICSQTVARCKKIGDLVSRVVPTIPFICEGAIQTTSMDTTPQPRRKKSRSDLVHLRSLPSTQPATKIGQVAWAWGEIESALAFPDRR